MIKFSVPYNGRNIKNYIEELEKRIEYVNDIYLALPGISNFFSVKMDELHDKNCEIMLQITKGTGLKRIVVLNDNYYDLNKSELSKLIDIVANKLNKYEPDGIVTTNIILAETIRNKFPEIEVSTSCNLPYYRLAKYKEWKNIGVTLVTPPRDTGRNIPLLKELTENNYKVRLLINEGCNVQCPAMGFCEVNKSKRECIYAIRKNRNFLHRCVILPRWLNVLDKYCSIYKLQGRGVLTERIFTNLDLYIKRDDCNYFDLFANPRINGYVSTEEIPDTLLHCGCNNCDNCNICEELYNKYPILRTGKKENGNGTET